MMPTKLLFIGTGEYAVPILEALLQDAAYEVVGVVTQPDKPSGRKQELAGGPVKKFVDRLPAGVRLFQPVKLRNESAQILRETTPDLIIVVAYGQMIPGDMLSTPKYGCLNIHGSLLPKLRGAVPIPMAILQGLSETGVTIQKMVAELDAGPLLAVEKVAIAANDTTASLMSKMSIVGRDLLLETLPKWITGQISPQEQDHTQATFCYQADIAKEKAEITYTTGVEQAERMIRAFYPWPVAWVMLDHQGLQRLKIFKAQLAETQDLQVGSELGLIKQGKQLFLTLHDGVLELLELQLEGKTRMPAADYLFLAD